MTANKEDYLKAIYDEGGLDLPVSNKRIAARLNIAPSSVTEMLLRLDQQGLLHYEAYKGSYLTEKGLQACLHVVRSHRLWEVFLMRHLGYSWREAHEDAHLLEHIAPERMMDRLDVFLNYPKTCPHGAWIPQREQSAPDEMQWMRLSDLSVGEAATLQKVVEDGALLDYLEQMGLVIGSRIQIVAVEAYEGPIRFIQNGTEISISHKAATQVFCTAINSQEKEHLAP